MAAIVQISIDCGSVWSVPCLVRRKEESITGGREIFKANRFNFGCFSLD
jgi:hypothetical protein